MSRAPIHDAAARGFEAAVERYERGRPGYPDDAVSYLVAELGIAEGRHVVELGAGTGKLTELIVHTGARITAIEPVASMRKALRRNCPTVSAIDATAEETGLPDEGADAVVAAQSFHWFDAERAPAEVHRILRPERRLGLIWNVRDPSSDWSEKLTAIFDRLAGDGPRYRDMAWRKPFERTDLFGPLHHQVAYHVHQVSREAFMDRVLSVSYVASAPEPERVRVVDAVHELLETDAELVGRDTLVVPYRTDVYWCARR